MNHLSLTRGLCASRHFEETSTAVVIAMSVSEEAIQTKNIAGIQNHRKALKQWRIAGFIDLADFNVS